MKLREIYQDLRFFIKYARRGWIIVRSPAGALAFGGPVSKARVFGRGKGLEVHYFKNREFLFAEFLAQKQYLRELRKYSQNIRARAGDRHLYVLDLGANVGFFSVLANLLLGKLNPHFIAFEPFSENRKLCGENCAKNGLTFTVRSEALSNQDGEDQRLEMISTTGATINPKEASSYREETGLPTPLGESVQVNRLDSLWGNLGIPRVDLIKMDIEGSEEWALEGAQETIRKFKPIIFCSYEHYQNSKKEILATVLAAHPYSVHDNQKNKILTFF